MSCSLDAGVGIMPFIDSERDVMVSDNADMGDGMKLGFRANRRADKHRGRG